MDLSSGIWGFPLTPFDADSVDLDLLAAGVEHQLAGGVAVLCAGGTIAQADRLSDAERIACQRTIAAAGAGRAPVVATIVESPTAPRQAADAVAAGASGLLVIPASPQPSAIRATLRAVAAGAGDVPLVLYHRPPLRLDPDDLRRLADDVPQLAWVKDGHRDVRGFRRLRAAAPRLRWVSAWEDVALAFWALGCDTFAPASTAYAPEYAAAWFARLRAGDLPGATALLEAHAYPIVDLRLSRPAIDVAVVKAAMEACGVPAGGLRPPAEALTAAERDAVDVLVARMHDALEARSAPSAPARS
jgi:dihydrodipicolinate synthase/N-acetylneuraminate lyase